MNCPTVSGSAIVLIFWGIWFSVGVGGKWWLCFPRHTCAHALSLHVAHYKQCLTLRDDVSSHGGVSGKRGAEMAAEVVGNMSEVLACLVDLSLSTVTIVANGADDMHTDMMVPVVDGRGSLGPCVWFFLECDYWSV